MEPYKPSYRIWESAPREYQIQYSHQVKAFFTRKVIREVWVSYGHHYGAFAEWNPFMYFSLEAAEKALALRMEAESFIPKTIKEYS